MNKLIIKNQAETVARAFEAHTSHKMKHSVALEIVSALYGKKNYNVLADFIKPQTALAELSETQRSHAKNSQDSDYTNECTVSTVNGRKILTAAYPQECDYIRITDRADHEIAYWSCDEWRDSPQEVMGAIVGALNGGESRELPQFAQQKAKGLEVLKKPMKFEQIKEIVAQGGNLSVVVCIAMYDFMQGIEYINDLAQELITGNEYFELEDGDDCVDVQAMLEDLSYTPVGVDGDNILVEVNAQIVYY